MSVWSDHHPASDVDPELIPFFGADPAWTPAMEEKLADAPDKPAGACIKCGGDEGFPLLDAEGLPVHTSDGSPIVVSEIPPGSKRVCMRCQRTGEDQHSQAARPRGMPMVVPRDDPGYVSRDGISVPERFARMLET